MAARWAVFWPPGRILARKSVFCYKTPDFVNGQFVTLDDRGDKNHSEFGIFPVPPFCQDRMGSALQDRKTPEGDEKNRKNRLETYSTIFLDSTGIEYARIEWVPPLRGAQPRISGSCFFAMIDWIPSEGGTHSEWVPPLREGHNTEFLGSAFLP